MEVKIILTPHIIRNCKDADEVAQRMAALVASLDTEGMEFIGVYPMPAARPEGDAPRFDVTILLKQTVPAE